MRNLPLICVLSIIFCFVNSCKEKPHQEKENRYEEVETSDQQAHNQGTILFFGDSLTAGLGVEEEETFPALIQRRIDSLRLPYTVINAGLSGETTAGGRNRIEWVLNQDVDIFVLELGANDGLRGVPVEETRRNLQAIINTVREKNYDTEIILAGMQIPPNMGREYASQFQRIFPELAKENDIHLIPFLLEDVGGVRELNQPDGIHPTAEGQRILAQNVWEVLEPIVRK